MVSKTGQHAYQLSIGTNKRRVLLEEPIYIILYCKLPSAGRQTVPGKAVASTIFICETGLLDKFLHY